MDCLPQIHVAAIHAEWHEPLQTATPGIGVLCRKGDAVFGTGVYRNSIARTSVYAMGGWQPFTIGPVRVGAVVGGVTGYLDGPPIMGGLVASWGNVHVLAWPRIKDKTPAGVAFSFTF